MKRKPLFVVYYNHCKPYSTSNGRMYLKEYIPNEHKIISSRSLIRAAQYWDSEEAIIMADTLQKKTGL